MRTLAWLTGVGICIASSLASAQDAPGPPPDPEAQSTAIARALFEEGLELADQQRWPEAADRFHRAMEIRSSPPLRYNLAGSLARMGRLLEAVELLRSVEGDPEAEESAVTAARQLRRRLERRLARLSIEVEGDTGAVQLTLDDRELPTAALGVEFPVDPGTHAVVLREDGRELDRADLELAEQQREVVRLSGPGAPAEVGSVLTEAWFWGAVTMVVVGATLATVVVLTADDDAGSTSGSLAPVLSF